MEVSLAKTVTTEASNVFKMTIESLLFGISGIASGTLIDKQFIKLSKKYEKHKLLIATLQIAVSGLFLAMLYFYVSPFHVKHFQATISGIAFPALFYGVQSNIYSTWQSIL